MTCISSLSYKTVENVTNLGGKTFKFPTDSGMPLAYFRFE